MISSAQQGFIQSAEMAAGAGWGQPLVQPPALPGNQATGTVSWGISYGTCHQRSIRCCGTASNRGGRKGVYNNHRRENSWKIYTESEDYTYFLHPKNYLIRPLISWERPLTEYSSSICSINVTADIALCLVRCLLYPAVSWCLVCRWWAGGKVSVQNTE